MPLSRDSPLPSWNASITPGQLFRAAKLNYFLQNVHDATERSPADLQLPLLGVYMGTQNPMERHHMLQVAL